MVRSGTPRYDCQIGRSKSGHREERAQHDVAKSAGEAGLSRASSGDGESKQKKVHCFSAAVSKRKFYMLIANKTIEMSGFPCIFLSKTNHKTIRAGFKIRWGHEMRLANDVTYTSATHCVGMYPPSLLHAVRAQTSPIAAWHQNQRTYFHGLCSASCAFRPCGARNCCKWVAAAIPDCLPLVRILRFAVRSCSESCWHAVVLLWLAGCVEVSLQVSSPVSLLWIVSFSRAMAAEINSDCPKYKLSKAPQSTVGTERRTSLKLAQTRHI